MSKQKAKETLHNALNETIQLQEELDKRIRQAKQLLLVSWSQVGAVENLNTTLKAALYTLDSTMN